MKKLSLVLGSLLIVGAVSSAKEVKPAPVVAPQVKVIEKEVVVYKEKEGNGVTGNIKVTLQNKFRKSYKNSEDEVLKVDKEGKAVLDKDGKEVYEASKFKTIEGSPASRLRVEGKVVYLPKHTLRFKSDVSNALRFDGTMKRDKGANRITDPNAFLVNLGYDYAYGEIGESGIKVTPSFDYKASTKGPQDFEFKAKFANANNLLENDAVKKLGVYVTPKYTANISTVDYKVDSKTPHHSKLDNKFNLDAGVDVTFVHDIKLGLSAGMEHNYNAGEFEKTGQGVEVDGVKTNPAVVKINNVDTVVPVATTYDTTFKDRTTYKVKAKLEKEFELYQEDKVTITAETEASVGAKFGPAKDRYEFKKAKVNKDAPKETPVVSNIKEIKEKVAGVETTKYEGKTEYAKRPIQTVIFAEAEVALKAAYKPHDHIELFAKVGAEAGLETFTYEKPTQETVKNADGVEEIKDKKETKRNTSYHFVPKTTVGFNIKF